MSNMAPSGLTIGAIQISVESTMAVVRGSVP
jgi:hypothetical protein